ncbi:hypothetical protein [Desulfohalovibrio reitneri]|nr:hypothetical protein [Desulfohalovibrio reitneri]
MSEVIFYALAAGFIGTAVHLINRFRKHGSPEIERLVVWLRS